MTKKHFIALADAMTAHNKAGMTPAFERAHFDCLAAFCLRQNHNFNMNRWLDYIAGKCGPNGGNK